MWFSAGAASAVAAKLTLAEPYTDDVVVAYVNPGSEHPDNLRFLDACQRWFGASESFFGRNITMLRSDKYADTWQVWQERRYLVGPTGALCTAELKKKVRFAFERPDDIQVFGYTVEEQSRADRFREQNPGVDLRCPLIERGLTKDDCLAIIERAGIELPAMYRLGYRNNNCVGCVKGGMGYWNKIRRDFPETFDRMAALERDLGHTVLRDNSEPLYLDELDPDRGNHADEPSFECSLMCQLAEEDL